MLDQKLIDPRLLRECRECKEIKLLIEFSCQKNKCKKCERAKRMLSEYAILSRNDSLKGLSWNTRRRRG
jgi:hypothetical protein